jgi:hypothetical protein
MRVRPNAHRDHVLCDLLAKTYACVVAPGSNVGQALFDDDLDLDIGILRQYFGELWPKDRTGCMLGGRYPKRAGRLFPKLI